MSTLIDRFFTAALVFFAGLVAVSLAYSTFVSRPQAEVQDAVSFVANWEAGVATGYAIHGDRDAPISIVTLVDLECPACAGLHRILKGLLKERPGDIRLVYVSFPLSYHRFAVGAARGIECAHLVGAASRWTEAVYAKQDSLGLKTWASYAHDAGIPDTARIETCIRDTVTVPRIRGGMEFGKQIGVESLPTVILNGWRFPQPPSRETLDSAIRALDQGTK